MAAEVLLMAGSALVILFLATAHLVLTFRGTRLHPRSASVRAAMEGDHPQLSSQTTMWKTWIGFNASHSFGGMLFGLVYGYLALCAGDLLFGSYFLLGLGLAFLLCFAFLGKRYWFSTPFRGIVVATLLYVSALVASRFQGP